MLPAAAGIRGFACLWVMVIHNFGFFVFPPGSVDGCGKIGVWLFFVLSAYLLTYKLVASGTSMPVLAAYAWGDFGALFQPSSSRFCSIVLPALPALTRTVTYSMLYCSGRDFPTSGPYQLSLSSTSFYPSLSYYLCS